jgi:hypothetical protein
MATITHGSRISPAVSASAVYLFGAFLLELATAGIARAADSPPPYLTTPHLWFEANRDLDVGWAADDLNLLTPDGRWLLAEAFYKETRNIEYETGVIAQVAAVMACPTDARSAGYKFIAIVARQSEGDADYRHAFDVVLPCGEQMLLLRETRRPLHTQGPDNGSPRPFRWWLWNIATDSVVRWDREADDIRGARAFAEVACAFRRTSFAVSSLTIDEAGSTSLRMKARNPDVEPAEFTFDYRSDFFVRFIPTGSRSFVLFETGVLDGSRHIRVRSLTVSRSLETLWDVKQLIPPVASDFGDIVAFGTITEPIRSIPLRGPMTSDDRHSIWHLEVETGKVAGPTKFPAVLPFPGIAMCSPTGRWSWIQSDRTSKTPKWICFRSDDPSEFFRSDDMPKCVSGQWPDTLTDKSLFFRTGDYEDNSGVAFYRVDLANPKVAIRLEFPVQSKNAD